MLHPAIKQTKALIVISTIVSYSALVNASPSITNVSLQRDTESQLVIEGLGFSHKANPKPLLWWHADGGEVPDPVSRGAWAESFSGTLSTSVYSEGSNQSYYFDHGSSSGAALARVDFNSGNLYMFRKMYEDFDVTKDVAIRVRGRDLSGGTLDPGTEITGNTSGATGTILKSSYVASNDRYDIYLNSKTPDSVNASTPTDFVFGETITTDSGATFTNAEGTTEYPTGTLRSFNYKTFRIWGDPNNSYPVAQGSLGYYYNFNHEHTDKTFWSSGMANKLFQLPRAWQYQEFAYKASDINTKNGHFEFAINGTRSVETDFISTTTDKPIEYHKIYQSQVSGGAQPGSLAHYDSLYIDDTWHRVMLCDQPNWDDCTKWEVQIPVEWNESQITLKYRLGSLIGENKAYVYVFDENGDYNTSGFEVATNPAKPPPGFSATY